MTVVYQVQSLHRQNAKGKGWEFLLRSLQNKAHTVNYDKTSTLCKLSRWVCIKVFKKSSLEHTGE